MLNCNQNLISLRLGFRRNFEQTENFFGILISTRLIKTITATKNIKAKKKYMCVYCHMSKKYQFLHRIRITIFVV
jgi:hypothetical protein